MFYYYCPNCNYEDKIKDVPHYAAGNPRDGYGRPIYHFECPNCHNLDAGAMSIQYDDEEEREYYRSVIDMYQNIRGIKKVMTIKELKKVLEQIPSDKEDYVILTEHGWRGFSGEIFIDDDREKVYIE